MGRRIIVIVVIVVVVVGVVVALLLLLLLLLLPKFIKNSARRSPKWYQNGVLGSSGASKMRSRGVQGWSQGGPGARGVPSGAPGLDFGPPPGAILGTILEQFWACFLILFFSNFCIILSCYFGAVWEPFWSNFGDILALKLQYEKCYVSEDVPGSPWPPPQSQKA